MLKSTSNTITRAEFTKLRLAKKIIKEEFNEELHLQDDDVIDQIYKFALESEDEMLFDLFNELAGKDPETARDLQPRIEPAPRTEGKKLRIGDVVDGKKVTGMYRGKPVFENL